MIKVFNKLVRDNIPGIIDNNGEVALTRILDDNEFKRELNRKLQEECNEVCECQSATDILNEISDIYEVILNIARVNGFTEDDLINKANDKRINNGSFINKVFLEKTYDKE